MQKKEKNSEGSLFLKSSKSIKKRRIKLEKSVLNIDLPIQFEEEEEEKVPEIKFGVHI